MRKKIIIITLLKVQKNKQENKGFFFKKKTYIRMIQRYEKSERE